MQRVWQQLDSRVLHRAGLLAALHCLAGVADASAQVSAGASLDAVVVTGSHIARTDSESALPVQVITRDEIERSGVTTTEQLLERLPANVNAFNAARSVGEFFRPGLSSANLRGLGGGATLVLLNGRRLANYAFDGESVDLNAIPLAVIERVEILKDGASAIYGADAIAGVINIILRKDYAGAELGGQFAVTQHGGGNERQFQLVAGKGQLAGDGFNVFAALNYQAQQRLPANERDFSKSAYRPDIGLDALYGATFPSNIVDRPGARIINPTAATGCSPPWTLPSRVYPFLSLIHI